MKKPTLERYKNFYKRRKEMETEESRWQYFFEEIGRKLHAIKESEPWRLNSRYRCGFDGVELGDFEGTPWVYCYEHGGCGKNQFESFKAGQAFDTVWLQKLEDDYNKAIGKISEHSIKCKAQKVEELEQKLKELKG